MSIERLGRRLALLAVPAIGSSILLGAAPAAAATKGDCTVRPATPTAPRVYPESQGKLMSLPRATVDCATPQWVRVEGQLWGEDPLSDDGLDYYALQFMTTPKPGVDATVGFGPPRRDVRENKDNCNEDTPGADELYSRVRIQLRIEGVWSGWSAWERGRTVSHRCN